MKSINFQQYKEIVVNDILNYSIYQLQDKYSHDIKFLYSVLNDLSLGSGSPNYKLINKIAGKENISFQFIVNTANKLISEIENDSSINYYKVLNIKNNATSDEVRESWLKLVKINHPDLTGEKGVEKTKELNEAYEVLKDKEKRTVYDHGYFDYYPLSVEYDTSSKFYSRKLLMLYSVVFVVAISFLLKGYFENFINNNNKNNHATGQLELFEEVDNEKSDLRYKKDVDELYSDFNKVEGDNSQPDNIENEDLTLQNIPADRGKIEQDDFEKNLLALNDTETKKIATDKPDTTYINEKKDSDTLYENDPLINSLIKKYGSKNRKNKKGEDLAKTSNNEIIKKDLSTKSNKKAVSETVAVNKESNKNTPKDKSDAELKAENPVVSSVPKSKNMPTTTSILLFVSDYVSAYKNRDYNMMKNLFLPGATENNMDINLAMDMYKSNFNKHKIIRYDIQVKNKSINGNNALVDANFVVIYKDNNNEKVNTKKGDISWKLKWIVNEWKINSLNYKFDNLNKEI